jgi:hypothetical protein
METQTPPIPGSVAGNDALGYLLCVVRISDTGRRTILPEMWHKESESVASNHKNAFDNPSGTLSDLFASLTTCSSFRKNYAILRDPDVRSEWLEQTHAFRSQIEIPQGCRRWNSGRHITALALPLEFSILSSAIVSLNALKTANVIITNECWGPNPLSPSTAWPGDIDVQLSLVLANIGEDVARDVNITL